MRFVNTKTLILIAIIIVLLLVIKNIAGSIASLKQNSSIVTALKSQETEEKQKKQFLQQRLYFVKTPQFIENEAREKLGMVKPGEHIILAPPATPVPQKIALVDTTPNWVKWWKLFF